MDLNGAFLPENSSISPTGIGCVALEEGMASILAMP